MNLRQLEALNRVIVTGSVSEAARDLHRTQPAVTALIKGLEESIGFPLFERRGRRLQPLPEAQYLNEEATQILDRIDQARNTMKALRSVERGTLRVASTLTPAVSLVGMLFDEIICETEGVSTSLVTGNSVAVHHLVASQQVDIGLSHMGREDQYVDTTLITHRTFDMDVLVATAADDPLAKRDAITPSDLSGRALAIPAEGHVVYKGVQQAFSAAGAAFNPRLFSQAALPKFVPIVMGSVVGIVDPMSVRAYLDLCGGKPEVAFVPFEPKISFEFAVMTPAFRPASQLGKLFEDRLLARLPAYISF